MGLWAEPKSIYGLVGGVARPVGVARVGQDRLGCVSVGVASWGGARRGWARSKACRWACPEGGVSYGVAHPLLLGGRGAVVVAIELQVAAQRPAHLGAQRLQRLQPGLGGGGTRCHCGVTAVSPPPR